MSDLSDINDRLNAAADKAEAGSQVIHDFANGDENTEVDTESGPIPTLSKIAKYFMDEEFASGMVTKSDLANMANPQLGAAMVAINQELAYGVGSLGGLLTDIEINVKQFPWLAKGDAKFQDPADGKWYKDAAFTSPATDDFAAIQAALNFAKERGGCTVYFPDGGYLSETGSPEVSSNCKVRGAGKHRSRIIQPNCYKYDRANVAYNRALVVDWNALWMDVTTSNVEIIGLGFLGPFYRQDGDYVNHPVENWPASNGVHHRGRDYQFRKSLPYTGEGENVQVNECLFEGWGEDATQIDYVTNLKWNFNVVRRCGRGGLRTYGCVNVWGMFNDIRHLSPGDYLNGRIVNGSYIGGNRMYGMEATRTYIAGCRPSENFWFCFNNAEDILYWKCYGTHGGVRGRFLFNTGLNSHHGIGIDKGGFTVEHGVAPPLDMWVLGNSLRRTAPGNPIEGDGENGPGHGIFITAHDGTDDHIGRGLVLDANNLEGWGTDNLFGAAWIGNWDGVQLGKTTIRNSVGAAIRLRDTLKNLSIDTQIISGVRRTGTTQRGISVESGTIYGILMPCIFENKDPDNDITAIYLSNNDGNTGLTIQAGHKLNGRGILSNLGANDIDGPFSLTPAAAGRCLVTGGTAALRGANGAASVTYSSVGVYLITVKREASSTDNIYAQITPVQNGRDFSQEYVSKDTVRIKMFLADGVTPVDNSFIFTIWSF